MILNRPDAPSIHSVPFCAGIKQKELEREKIDKTQEARVAESIITQWVSPIVFDPKKDEVCVSVWTIGGSILYLYKAVTPFRVWMRELTC